MSEVRLIDANALYREVKTECNPYGKPTIEFNDGKLVLELIDVAPTIEAAPVRHGRWILNSDENFMCSQCRHPQQIGAKDFCGKCGAKMDGDSE